MLYVFSGVVIRIWGPLEPGERLEATTMMLGNSITVRRKISDTSSSQEMRDVFKNYWEKYNDNPLLGRDNILASICPKVYRFIVHNYKRKHRHKLIIKNAIIYIQIILSFMECTLQN